jgi:hypothetical protein
MATLVVAPQAASRADTGQPVPRRSAGRVVGMLALVVGAIVFLFPFYYMVIGSLQREPQTDLAGAFPNPANLTVDNFSDINAQVDLARTLVNSGIFTGGVLLSTLVFGLLAGYALAVLRFRGRTVLFTVMLLSLNKTDRNKFIGWFTNEESNAKDLYAHMQVVFGDSLGKTVLLNKESAEKLEKSGKLRQELEDALIIRLQEKARRLQLDVFEKPDFHDILNRARLAAEPGFFLNVLWAMWGSASSLLAAVAIFVMVGRWSPLVLRIMSINDNTPAA